MSEKVVLPNFDLPRDSTRIAMRMLWGVGGAVVVATLVLGLAMWHHRSLEIANAQEAAAKAEAARRAAMAPPPAPKLVEKTTPVGGSATTLATTAAGSASGSASAAAPAADAERPAVRAHSHRSAKSGRGHGMRGAALLEKIDGKGAKNASKPAKPAGHGKADDDFIDSLLKK